MTNLKKLNNAEQAELLRYFVGTPPYIQDARFRELRDIFAATDERTDHEDARYNVDYENDRIKDAEDETGSVPNDTGTVQGGKYVKPDENKKKLVDAATNNKAK